MEIHVLSGTWITNSSSVGFKLSGNVGTRNGTVTLISRFTLENRNEIHRQKISMLNFSIKQAGKPSVRGHTGTFLLFEETGISEPEQR